MQTCTGHEMIIAVALKPKFLHLCKSLFVTISSNPMGTIIGSGTTPMHTLSSLFL